MEGPYTQGLPCLPEFHCIAVFRKTAHSIVKYDRIYGLDSFQELLL